MSLEQSSLVVQSSVSSLTILLLQDVLCKRGNSRRDSGVPSNSLTVKCIRDCDININSQHSSSQSIKHEGNDFKCLLSPSLSLDSILSRAT